MKNARDAVVVAFGRSPMARANKGSFANMHPVEYSAQTLMGVLDRLPGLDRDKIDDVIMGCATPEGECFFNIARLVAQRAGLSDDVTGQTVNRFCSSGLQAIALAAGQIACGVADVIVAGGVESMTSCPVNVDISDTFDPDLLLQREEEYLPMGLTAENVAARYNVTRQEMDELAVESHRRAAAAQDAGKFDDEIIPLPGVDADGNPMLKYFALDGAQADEYCMAFPKGSELVPVFNEALAQLKQSGKLDEMIHQWLY